MPESIDWPASFFVLCASFLCSAIVIKFVVFEWRARRFLTTRALASGERLDKSSWSKLEHTWVLLWLCITMAAVQTYFLFGTRKDLRSKIPLLGKFFVSEVEDLRSYLTHPSSGTSDDGKFRVAGELPRPLILRKGSIVPFENGLYVWPSQLDSQNKLATLNFKTRRWTEVTTGGAVPEFRFDPETLVVGGKVYFWGGSADDDTISSLKRRPFKGGSVYDVRTRTWSTLPSIPDANLLRSSRIMQMGSSLVLVSLNYDKSSNGFVNSYVLSEDSKTWKPFKSVALKDFNAVEIYCEKGLVVVVGELGQEGDGVLKSVNKVATSVKDVLEIGTFQERIQISNDSSFRFRVFDFADNRTVRSAEGKLEPVTVELPQGLNGAMVVAHSPGLLFLKGADEELILCRFRPFECPRLVNSLGTNIKAGARKSMGGRIYGDVVYFWQSDRSEFQSYNFGNRSLETIPFGDQEKKSVPLFVFPGGTYLFAQTSGQDTLAEAEFKAEIRAIACGLVPFRSQIKICSALKSRADAGKQVM